LSFYPLEIKIKPHFKRLSHNFQGKIETREQACKKIIYLKPSFKFFKLSYLLLKKSKAHLKEENSLKNGKKLTKTNRLTGKKINNKDISFLLSR
jgi:hypothetical protein